MNGDKSKETTPAERPLQMRNAPDEEHANPAGLGASECDAIEPQSGSPAEPCDAEGVEDLVLGESLPGFGVPGYDAEEDGGG
jgi:hypothetical protein